MSQDRDCNSPETHHADARRRYPTPILRVMVLVASIVGTVAASPGQEVADSPDNRESETQPPPPLSLESLFHPKQKHRYVTPTAATHWVGGQSSQLLIRRGDRWNQYDVETGKETPWPVFEKLKRNLLTLDGISEKQANAAALTAVSRMKRAGQPVLVPIQSSLAIVDAGVAGDRTGGAGFARWLTRDAKSWRNATLAANGRWLGYCREGDFFVFDLQSGRTLRLTRDASETLLDGILDWTYQEEIFGRGNFKGFWFSPDGDWVAMLRIDISAIEPYTLGSASGERGTGVVSRYPKAGDPIPQASLVLWDLRQADQGVVPPPQLLAESTAQDERIVTGVWWHAHHRALYYCVSDRLQTWRELHAVGEPFFQGGRENSSLILREDSPAWVEPPTAPGWLADGSFVWRSELPTGRNRLYHVSANGAVVTPKSPEDFDVRGYQVRADGAFAIVTGNASGRPGERHAYRIDFRAGTQQLSHLIPLTRQPGWHSTQISPDGTQLVDSFSTPTEPPVMSVRSTLGAASLPIDRAELRLPQELIQPQLFRITTEDRVPLPAMLVRPPSASARQPCPVMVAIYGGPQAPIVSARWQGSSTLYRELLAREGIATLVVDNRSSAGRGIVDTWAVRGRLGVIELKDVLAAVDWLHAQDWVDSDRIGIRGWSFGGFLTLYAMTHSDRFAAGIAGGSVTDWREYDAFYTERYMGLPSANPEGYATTSVIAAADRLQGKVLLIHGEADDNVHPSGTMRMVDALQKAGKDFRLMIYPGAAHAIRHPGQVWHMSQMTHRFLLDQLRPNDRGKASGEKGIYREE